MIPGEPDVCPECAQGKHVNCTGDAWDYGADEPTACDCYRSGHHL